MSNLSFTPMQRRAIEASQRGENLPGLSTDALRLRLKRACRRVNGVTPKACRGRRRVIFSGDMHDIADRVTTEAQAA